MDLYVPRSTHHDTLTGLLLQDKYISKYLLSVLCNCMLLNLLVYHLWSGVGDESNNSIGGSVTVRLERWTCNLEALSLTLTACWICSFVLSSPDFKSSTIYACTIANWFAPYQWGFLNMLCSISIKKKLFASLSLKSPTKGEDNYIIIIIIIIIVF